MSTVEKLLIKGIRSYDAETHQVIEFLHPMTVIIGANGCGKTTIIECLKYMTTGDFPPMSKGCFVHDPKVAGETAVHACIKLRFTNVSGKTLVATKNLKSSITRSSANPSLKSLEGALLLYDEEGKKTKLSSRCTELEKQMIIHLGVSKSVLSSVIFCHQEDSLWPLSEPTRLKAKFDDIFSSTRYIKALDAIKKLRLEKNQAVGELEVALGYLRDNKQAAQRIRKRMKETQKQINALTEQIDAIDEELAPINDQLQKLDAYSAKIHEQKTKMAVLKDRYKHLKQQCSEKKQHLAPPLDDTTEELKAKLSRFGAELKEKRRALEQKRQKQEELKNSAAAVEEELSNLKTDLGAFTQANTEYKRKVKERKELVVDMSRDLAITDVIEPEAFLAFIQEKLKQEQAKLNETKGHYDKREKHIDEKHEQKRAKFSQLQARLQHLRQTESKCRDTIKSLTRQLESSSAQTRDVASLDAVVEAAEREHQDAQAALEAFDQEAAEANLPEQKKRVQRELQSANDRLQRIRRDGELQRKIKAAKEFLAANEDKVEKLLKKHGPDLAEAAGDEMPAHQYYDAVKTAIESQERQYDNAIRRRDAAVQHLADKNARQAAIKQSLESLQQKHQAWEERLAKECPGGNVQEAVAKEEEKLQSLRSMRDLRPAMQKVYKIIERKSRQRHACFVCQRDFASDEEEEDCLKLIEEKIAKFSLDSSGEADEVGTQQSLVDKLKGLELESRQFQQQEERVSEYEGTLAALDNEIEELEAEKEKVSDHMHDINEAIQRFRGLKDVAKELKTCQSRITERQREVEGLSSRLTAGGADSLEEAEAAVHQLQQQREKLLQKESAMVQQRGKLQDACVKTQQEVSKKKDDLAKTRETLAEHVRVREQIDSKQKELTATQEQRTALKKDQQQFEKAMEDADRERQDLRHERDKMLDSTQRGISKYARCSHRLEGIEADIKRYESSGQEKRLQQCRESLEQRRRDHRELLDRKEDLERHVSQLSSDISTHKQFRLNVEANLAYRQQQEELQGIAAEVDALRQDMAAGQEEEEGVLGDRAKLEEDRNRRLEHKHTLTGRRGELENKLKADAKDLKAPHLKNVDADFQRKSIECEATKQLQDDLQKYHSALDNAIVKFHALKMDAINRIIKEIWQKTYQGNDIDYVEIVSDVEKKKETSRGKSYQYRVVMVKGDTRLDMRGRCSAGQKVMASIIIRLALADCFCANCGVLTLDEPTTNLDHENKEALAKCLAEIVNDRKTKQPNFQLLLITHDEKFLELLHRYSLGRIYYRVSKDERGHSTVRQVSA